MTTVGARHASPLQEMPIATVASPGGRLRTPGNRPSAHCLAPPPRVGATPSTAIAACTDIAGAHVTDRAERTRGDESLRPISNCR